MEFDLDSREVTTELHNDLANMRQQVSPKFVEAARESLSKMDPQWKYLRDEDVDFVVDIYLIRELYGEERARQYFIENAVRLYSREPLAFSFVMAQLKIDRFFSEDEIQELTRDVIVHITQDTDATVLEEPLTSLENVAPCKDPDYTPTKDEVLVSVDKSNHIQTTHGGKAVRNILALLLALAVCGCAVLGYLLYDTANLYTEADTERIQKTQRVTSLKNEVSELENELDLYKTVAKSYDNHAVIVVPEVDNYYHRIGCSHLPDSYTYWSYNVESAVDHGYSRCPDCMTMDFDEYVQTHF